MFLSMVLNWFQTFQWKSVYALRIWNESAETGKVSQVWNIKFMVRGDQVKMSGGDHNSLALQSHMCYNNLVKPWCEQSDFVVLGSGKILSLAHGVVIEGFEESGKSLPQITIGEMNISELTDLVDDMRRNQQPKTKIGGLAIDLADKLEAQMNHAKAETDELFHKLSMR